MKVQNVISRKNKSSRMPKILMQFIASMFVIFSGNYIHHLNGLFGIHEISTYVGIPLTIFFVISAINAFSIMDGVDGLAGILGGIATLTLGALFVWEQNTLYSILSFAAAALLFLFQGFKFLRYRKMFMGTVGSLILGSLVVFLAMSYCTQSGHATNSFIPQPIAIAWSVLFIPIFDMLRVACIRIYHRKPLFRPDRNHIHHKLIDLGYSHKETSIILAVCAIVLIMFNIIMRQNQVNINIILLLDLGMSFLFSIDLSRQKEKEKQTRKEEKTRIPLPDGRFDLLKTEK